MDTHNLSSLSQLESNVAKLLEERQQLKEQLDSLQLVCERQRKEMVRTHAEMTELQKQYRLLRTAYALAGNTEQREAAKKQITKLIETIDKALEYLAL